MQTMEEVSGLEVGYQKLFVESLMLSVNQVRIEDLAMGAEVELQFPLKDKWGQLLACIYGEGSLEDEGYSFQAGRPQLGSSFSIGNVMGVRKLLRLKGYQRVIDKDPQDKLSSIWGEGMKLPVIEIS